MISVMREKWLRELEAGKFQQIDGYLKVQVENETAPRYCCLGVACELYFKQKKSGFSCSTEGWDNDTEPDNKHEQAGEVYKIEGKGGLPPAEIGAVFGFGETEGSFDNTRTNPTVSIDVLKYMVDTNDQAEDETKLSKRQIENIETYHTDRVEASELNDTIGLNFAQIAKAFRLEWQQFRTTCTPRLVEPHATHGKTIEKAYQDDAIIRIQYTDGSEYKFKDGKVYQVLGVDPHKPVVL